MGRSGSRAEETCLGGIVLAPGARSKPTAFQAVSFQPPSSVEGGRGGGIPAHGARGHGSEVPHGLDHQVSVSDVAGRCCGAIAGVDPLDLCGTGSDDHPRGGVAGSHPPVGGGAASDLPGEAGAVHQGAVVAAAATGVPRAAQTLLGATPVGPGVFLRQRGRGRRSHDSRVYREPTMGRGCGGIQDYRAARALSRLSAGRLQAASAARRLSVGS